MKKIIAILAVLMLIPFTAFGLESLSDDVLDDVTAQAGVSIAVDIMMDVSMDTMAWGDSDGIDADATQTEGWIGLKNFDMQDLRIRLNSNLAANQQYGDIRLFTIDVATDATRGTYVHMVLGSQHITMASMKAEVQLGSDNTLGTVMGDFAIYGFDMIMDGDSYVDISAHGGAGVTIDFDIAIDSIDIASMAWGDADGLGAAPIFSPDPANPNDGLLQGTTTTTTGYVGFANMEIRNMTITGQVMIDVATIDFADVQAAGPAAGLVGVYAAMLGVGYDGGQTGVLMQLNNINFGMGSFAADIVLARDDALSTNAATMGSVYIENMAVNMNGWVGIFAH